MDAIERTNIKVMLETCAKENPHLICGGFNVMNLLLDSVKCISDLEETVACLSESNEIKRKECEYKVSVIEQRNRIIDEKNKQIEKMKMCANCANWTKGYYDSRNHPCEEHECDGECSLWTLWEER